MIYVGLDDTDTLETPGTNKLAMHIAEKIATQFETLWIVRHQLLVDPRVPCTNKNGCASLLLNPLRDGESDLSRLIQSLKDIIVPWCPVGSDPGLCVTETVPEEVTAWGQHVQSSFVHQSQALALAHELNIFLEPLGGTGDGVIGALAAVGLMASRNSGRVVYCGKQGADSFNLQGCHDIATLKSHGVDEIVCCETQQPITCGTIDVGKHLRPNLRHDRVVLYARPVEQSHWLAERVVA